MTFNEKVVFLKSHNDGKKKAPPNFKIGKARKF